MNLDYPLIFRLEKEPIDKNKKFIKKLWELDIDIEKGIEENIIKISKEGERNKRKISIDEFLNKFSNKGYVKLLVGIMENYKKFITLNSLYSFKSESEESIRLLLYTTKFEHEKEINKLFKSVYGASFENYNKKN